MTEQEALEEVKSAESVVDKLHQEQIALLWELIDCSDAEREAAIHQRLKEIYSHAPVDVGEIVEAKKVLHRAKNAYYTLLREGK